MKFTHIQFCDVNSIFLETSELIERQCHPSVNNLVVPRRLKMGDLITTIMIESYTTVGPLQYRGSSQHFVSLPAGETAFMQRKRKER